MKSIKLLPLAVMVMLSNQTLAEQNQPKFFAGIELGLTQHTVDVSDAGANYEPESGNSFAPSLSFGYNINENWSIATQYTNYGEADLFTRDVDLITSNATIPLKEAHSAETTGFSLVGQYMSARHVGSWGLGAKLGLMKWDTDYHLHYTNNNLNFDETLTEADSGVAIYGGFIGSYAINQHLDFTMSVDWFVNGLDVEVIEDANTDMQYSKFSAGLKYYW